MSRRPMILSAFFFNPQGDHRMSWRYPSAPGREICTLEYYRQLAAAAEAALRAEQQRLADQFAGRGGLHGLDRYRGATWTNL
jgi:hypothetical protein